MPAAINSEEKAAWDAVEAALTEDADRPLSDNEREAIGRIKKKLDAQLAALERK